MNTIIKDILNQFISGQMTHVHLQAKFNQMKESIQNLRDSESLTQEEEKLFKLFQIANEDAELRLDKAFISKVI